MFIIVGMKKLNLYIAKQIVVGFLLVAFCLMSIIWLTQSLRFIELITNKGISLSIFIKMTSLLMPRIFTILAPISLFAAVLFVYNRMLSDRELSVMKAAGISPWENAKPALFIGVIMFFFNIYIMNIGIPVAENAFKDLEWQVKNDVSQLMFREGEFTTIQPNLTLFITSHEHNGSVGGVLINDDRDPQTRSTISAELGRIVHTEKGPRIILVHGNRQELNRKTNQFSSVSFDRYSVDFGAKESKARKAAGVREKTLKELLSALNNKSLSPEDARRWFVEGNKRFTTPFLNLVYALIACTGLLVGNFNRRGQIKLISYSVGGMVLIQALDLALGNMAAKKLYWLILMYINLITPCFICLWMLFFYSPTIFHKRKRYNSEEQ
ncbi:MAG: LPS export ABC transporter permease LptF [Alphaproteobacteria bacterium]|nr:LPS export ABC transporter permease LptF [Alphaproteobacteria bacterium]